MINKVSLTQNKVQTSFKANIPETLGKKACDKMAKQLLETGTQKEQAFAKQYFSSIKKIKKEKGIDEVLLCSTNKATSMPYVSADGYHVRSYDFSNIKENSNISNRKTLMLMNCVNFAAETLENVIISINAL